jgi:glyoxalase superfamily protein
MMQAAQASETSPLGLHCRLDELVVDCADPHLLAAFWSAALDYEISDDDQELSAIEDPSGAGPSICFQKVPEPRSGKNRVHFDLAVAEHELDDAVSGLIQLGASKLEIGQGHDSSWVVMADPEGNEFCVVT